ncbi:MAG: nucleoside triphosphate pyrophosphohydrolase [Balneolaceae bacterium]
MKPGSNFDNFVKLVEQIRINCPWDRKQTHHTIKDHLIEEAYEVIDAIDRENPEDLKNELGDLLLHVVFHSQIASEKPAFSIENVIGAVSEKLVRRHPHVFAGVKATEKQVAGNWEAVKLEEGKKSTLDGLPPRLPALIRARRMQEKAGNVGFDWPDWEQAWTKLNEELEEWKEAIHNQDHNARMDEFGDLLFSLVNVGRLLELNAEDSLRKTNRKFENRFRFIEKQLQKKKRSVTDATIEEMDSLWEEAKERES